MNLAELLVEQAGARPIHAAIIDPRPGAGRKITFAELNSAAARAAGLLRASGLKSGDTVLILQPMSIELYVALAAVFRLGMVAMFLDPGAGRKHIEQCCALGAPQGLVASSKAHLLRLISGALRRIPKQFCIGLPLPWAQSFSRWGTFAPENSLSPCAPESPALLTFTSGSTGRPKAALRSHGFLFEQQRVLESALDLSPGEHDLTTLPTFALANLARGVTTVIPRADFRADRHADPAQVISQIEAHRIDRIGAAPAFLEWLADHCQQTGQRLASIHKIYTGGGPVYPKLLDRLNALAPHARITALYGCTEAEPIAVIERAQISSEDQRAVAQGKGLIAGHLESGISARIIPDQVGRTLGPMTPTEFEAQCLPARQAGEIIVRGGHVLPCYLSASDNAETKIHVEDQVWHRTGDAGYLDAAGRLWLLGRCQARVEDGHGRLYPFEIEGFVRQQTQRCRATVIAEEGQRVLYVDRQSRGELECLMPDLHRWHIDRIRVVNTLPLDRRHGSRIDYATLRRESQRRGGP